jgi:ketosteroid isomerase-like protein
MKHVLLTTILLAAMPFSAFGLEMDEKGAQTGNAKAASVSQELYNEIARMDSVLFEAFNTQNLDKLKTLFTDDLEFYHDAGGLALYSQTIKDFKTMFEQNLKIRRELVKGSLEIYPIKNYGAIETGQHRFCHIENGKDECGTFKFVHVWQKKGGEWKISRIISYNH